MTEGEQRLDERLHQLAARRRRLLHACGGDLEQVLTVERALEGYVHVNGAKRRRAKVSG